MARLPYFAFWADDFIAGTLGMPDAEVGVYIKLLAGAWAKDGISDAEARSVSRDDRVIDNVLRDKFTECEDGRFRNEKLESVRDTQAKRQQSGSKGGSKTASKPQANGVANDAAKVKHHNQIQTHIQSTYPEPNPNPKKDSNGGTSTAAASPLAREWFDEFWEVVHLKKGKDAAFKAFGRAVKRKATDSGQTQRSAASWIVRAMTEFAASPEADPPDRTPIHPATWLNQGRFDDDRSTWHRRAGPTQQSDKTERNAAKLLAYEQRKNREVIQ